MKNDIQPRAIALDSSGYIHPRYVAKWETQLMHKKVNVYCGVLLIAKIYLQHWIAQNKAMTCELY